MTMFDMFMVAYPGCMPSRDPSRRDTLIRSLQQRISRGGVAYTDVELPIIADTLIEVIRLFQDMTIFTVEQRIDAQTAHQRMSQIVAQYQEQIAPPAVAAVPNAPAPAVPNAPPVPNAPVPNAPPNAVVAAPAPPVPNVPKKTFRVRKPRRAVNAALPNAPPVPNAAPVPPVPNVPKKTFRVRKPRRAVNAALPNSPVAASAASAASSNALPPLPPLPPAVVAHQGSRRGRRSRKGISAALHSPPNASKGGRRRRTRRRR